MGRWLGRRRWVGIMGVSGISGGEGRGWKGAWWVRGGAKKER